MTAALRKEALGADVVSRSQRSTVGAWSVAKGGNRTSVARLTNGLFVQSVAGLGEVAGKRRLEGQQAPPSAVGQILLWTRGKFGGEPLSRRCCIREPFDQLVGKLSHKTGTNNQNHVAV